MGNLVEAVTWWVQITRDDVSYSYAQDPVDTSLLIDLRRILGSAMPMRLLRKNMTIPCNIVSALLGLTYLQ